MLGLTYPESTGSANFTNNHTIAILSAWLKKNRPDERVVFTQSLQELMACDEVWCTSPSETFGAVNDIGKVVVGAGKKFVVGGHHVTACPDSLKFGELHKGPLDGTELLTPDWDICGGVDKQYIGLAKQYVAMSSFGCPFACTFCSSTSFWHRHLYKPIDNFVSEIEELKLRGAKYVNIFDDLFALDIKRLQTIAERLAPLQMDFGCLIRADVVNQERLTLLGNMGVKNIAFGAESGSDRVLSLMNKHTTVEHNQHAVDLLVDGKFGAVCSLVVGHPFETINDLDKTIDFVRKNRDRMLVKVYPCIPFPGTRLWKRFVRTDNVNVRNFDWSRLRMEKIDWDKYPIMVEYERRRLIDVVENTKEI